MLGRIMLHYSIGNRKDGEISALMLDYIDDLSEFPAWAIDAACKAYRRNAANEFFPKVGVLIKLCKEIVEPVKQDQKVIRERIATQNALTYQPEIIKPEQVDALMAELRASLMADEAKDKPQPKAYDRAYFEALRAPRTEHIANEIEGGGNEK